MTELRKQVMELGTMADLAGAITPEKRARIDVIKERMVDAERGHELAALRKAQGLTQAQVAAAMGVTQGRISQIERGAAQLDTATMAAYLQAIGGELTLIATVGEQSVRLLFGAERPHGVDGVGFGGGLVFSVAQHASEPQREPARIPRAALHPVEGDLHDQFRPDINGVRVASLLQGEQPCGLP
jgi:transcriptional regulator with XRE-family HTH domain